jgi:hypothetical protein
MMITPELDGIVWHVSSYTYSSGNYADIGRHTSSHSYGSGNCVEVAPAPDRVQVRDSKHRTGGGVADARSTGIAHRERV